MPARRARELETREILCGRAARRGRVDIQYHDSLRNTPPLPHQYCRPNVSSTPEARPNSNGALPSSQALAVSTLQDKGVELGSLRRRPRQVVEPNPAKLSCVRIQFAAHETRTRASASARHGSSAALRTAKHSAETTRAPPVASGPVGTTPRDANRSCPASPPPPHTSSNSRTASDSREHNAKGWQSTLADRGLRARARAAFGVVLRCTCTWRRVAMGQVRSSMRRETRRMRARSAAGQGFGVQVLTSSPWEVEARTSCVVHIVRSPRRRR